MKILALLLVSALLASCGFISETIEDLAEAPKKLPGLLTVPVRPVYLAASDSYLKAEGSCEGYQVIEFTYSSPLTPSKTVLAKCENNAVSAELPVLQGDRSQTFSVKIIGYLAAPTTTSPLPPNLIVQYTPPVRVIAGFGVTSGGGKLSSATASISNSTVGEVTVGTQTSGSTKIQNGLHGSIDND